MIKRLLLTLLLILFSTNSFGASQERVPTANGTTSNWTYGGSGGGCVSDATKWECVNETIAAPDDANYVYRATSNDTQMFEYTDFAITSTAVTNVTVNARCREVGGNVTLNFRLRVSGAETYTGGATELTTSFADYTSGTTWNNNPATAAAWTEAEVEGAALEQFGIYPTNIIGGETVECSQVSITVNYTAPTTNPALFNSGDYWE